MYLFCISCKKIVATIKVPTFVKYYSRNFGGQQESFKPSQPNLLRVFCVTKTLTYPNLPQVTVTNLIYPKNLCLTLMFSK